MAQDIKNKTVTGISWSAIDSVASQGVTFIVGIVLARLLSPEEFGTIGIAMIFVTLFNKIVDCGFSNALIRKLDANDDDYNTTFIFNLVLSIVLYLVCYFIAPYISSFFNNDFLVGVVRWISLVLIINAFAIIQRTKLVKKVDFKTQAKISIGASVVSGAVGIIMAFYGLGVWSLVGQQLTRQLCNTLFLWISNKWRPKFVFSVNSFKNLFSYGGKLMLSGIVDTICNEVSTILIGKIYSPATLGQYSRAKQFSGIFSTNVSTVMERVTYPVLSEFQNNDDLLISYYRKIVRSLMLITGVGTIFIASCAKPIILVLLGPKWTEAILYLQLIAFVEITIPIKNVNLNLLQVYGRSDYILILSIIKRVIELGAVCLGFISLPFMIGGFAVAGVMGLLMNSYCTMKVSGYKVSSQIKDLLPSCLVAAVVGMLMLPFSIIIKNIYIALIVQLLVGSITFFLISEKLKLEEYVFLKQLLIEYFSKLIKHNSK